MRGVNYDTAGDFDNYYTSLTRVRESRLADRGWQPGDEKPAGLGPCGWCRGGDHDRCWAAYCWHCPAEHRKPGVRQPVAGPMRGGVL